MTLLCRNFGRAFGDSLQKSDFERRMKKRLKKFNFLRGKAHFYRYHNSCYRRDYEEE
jgi:hypothetical protein